MVTQTEIGRLDVERIKPVTAEASPIVEPFQIRAGLAEEFQLHLFKLTHTEYEITGSNFVSERLANLSNTERHFFTACSLDIGKVYKNTLSRFGAEIQFIFAVLRDTLKSLKHEIELTNIGKIMLSAVRAGDSLFFDIVCHLFIRPACNICAVKVLDEIVCTVTGFALTAVHERVGKSAQMSRSNPSLRVHEDSGVKSDIVFIFLHELFKPCSLDIVFKSRTQRTVIPSISQAAVYFRAGIYKATTFTECNNFVHSFLSIFHFKITPKILLEYFNIFFTILQEYCLKKILPKRKKCV